MAMGFVDHLGHCISSIMAMILDNEVIQKLKLPKIILTKNVFLDYYSEKLGGFLK
jgi:hypothetical protein